MDVSIYVTVVLLVTMALADESKSKNEVAYSPYGQFTEPYKYPVIGGYDYYNRQQPYYRQPTYPYSQQYYQRYPYNQQYYGQEYNNVPYVFGYPPPQTSSYHQNAFGYTNSPSYDAIAIRQAPVYPSPGAQPIGPPVPHPFYHTPGTYYPNEIVTVKPAVPADPKKYAR